MDTHNAELEERLLKTCKKSDCSREIALQWLINAKNFSLNVHKFSPNQLVFSMNPTLPNVLCYRLLALENLSKSNIFASDLRNINEVEKVFIKSESSEKTSYTLHHNVRSYKDAVFVKGYIV